MSQGEVSWILGAAAILPFPSAILMALFGSNARARRSLAVLYAVLASGINLALLNGFLGLGRSTGWGSLRLSSLCFPLFFMVNMTGVAAVLYTAFCRNARARAHFIMAAVALGAGLAALSFMAEGLAQFVILTECATVAALAGLLAQGKEGMRKRLSSFVPWLASDLIFALGALLSWVVLDETSVLVKPPLTKGGEAQVVVVMVLFLVSAVLRLGVFPFHYWVADMLGSSDNGWNAFFLGGLNFPVAGFRLFVVAALVVRLVAGDWSTLMVVVGAVSVVAGALLAGRARGVPGFIGGMYSMQGGFLVVAAGLFSRAGTEGGLFYLAVAPMFLVAVMMAAGTVDELRGSRELGRYRLSARIAPAAFIALLISGLSLSGIPPLDGFAGKAFVEVSCMDKAATNPYYALVTAVLLASTAVASLALARTMGGVFTGRGGRAAPSKPDHVQSFVTLALCGGSILLGVFPGLLLNNFIARGSRILFPAGFKGPGVAFRGTATHTLRALSGYLQWSGWIAAFALAVALFMALFYFSSRAAHPSAGTTIRSEPFMGGSSGDYRSSGDGAFEAGGRLLEFARRRLSR